MKSFGMEIVHIVSDERNDDGGVWFYLKPGYIWANEVHCIHEATIKACKAQFKNVTVCTCDACTQVKK